MVARIYDAKRAEVYERLGIPTVATVPWTTDRLLRSSCPRASTPAWRDPTGTVAILPLPLHQDWVGTRSRTWRQAAGSRAAFIIRFGEGVLPTARHRGAGRRHVYVAAVSGTVSDVRPPAAAPAEED